MKIKNIIFDVGNVLVRWEPLEVISASFPELEPREFYKNIYPIWIDLNLGIISEKQAIEHYHNKLGISKQKLSNFMFELKKHQKPLSGSLELLEQLKVLDYNLFSITDNIKEIIDYHKNHSKFPAYFKDIIDSADIGILKPDKKIYMHLLEKHKLEATESIFIDDLLINVEGAIAVGINSFQFTDYQSCIKKLNNLLDNKLL